MNKRNNTTFSNKIKSYFDQEAVQANRKMNDKFYGEDKKDEDIDLYNTGDSTPVIIDLDEK